MHTKRAKFIFDVVDEFSIKHPQAAVCEQDAVRLVNLTINRVIEEIDHEKAQDEPEDLAEELPKGHRQ